MPHRPNTWKRAVVATASLSLAALMLVGCGRTTPGTPTETGPVIDDKPATGTINVWALAADAPYLEPMVEAFEKLNPDSNVVVTSVPDAEFTGKLTAAVAAGSTPDVAPIYTDSIASQLATGGFDPVPKDLVKEGDFVPVSWNSSVHDETQYGVPWMVYSLFLLYRTDLLADAGAEVPTDWASLATAAKKLKANGVKWPLALDTSWGPFTASYLQQLTEQAGGSLTNADHTAWTLNSPEAVEGLDFYAQLFEDGLASLDGPTYVNQIQWGTDGTNALIPNSASWIPAQYDFANGEGWSADHLGVAATPAGPDGTQATTVSGASLFVPTAAKNKDGAWKFARYMASYDGQLLWWNTISVTPTLKAVWEDPALSTDNSMLDVVEAGLDSAILPPPVSTWSQVSAMLGGYIEKASRGTMTAQEALDAAQAEAESIGVGK